MDYPKLLPCPHCAFSPDITETTNLDGPRRYFFLRIVCHGHVGSGHCFSTMESPKRLYVNKFEDADKKEIIQAAEDLAERWNSRKTA